MWSWGWCAAFFCFFVVYYSIYFQMAPLLQKKIFHNLEKMLLSGPTGVFTFVAYKRHGMPFQK